MQPERNNAGKITNGGQIPGAELGRQDEQMYLESQRRQDVAHHGRETKRILVPLRTRASVLAGVILQNRKRKRIDSGDTTTSIPHLEDSLFRYIVGRRAANAPSQHILRA